MLHDVTIEHLLVVVQHDCVALMVLRELGPHKGKGLASLGCTDP